MMLQFCWSFSYFCSFKHMLWGGRHQIKVFPLSKKHFAISNFISRWLSMCSSSRSHCLLQFLLWRALYKFNTKKKKRTHANPWKSMGKCSRARFEFATLPTCPILKKDWCIHAAGETYLFHLDFKEVLTRYRFYTLYSHKQEKRCHKMSHCRGFKNKPAYFANGLKYYLGRFPNRDLVLRALRATVTQTLLF